MADKIELPDEVKDLLDSDATPPQSELDKLAIYLTGKRDEAVAARTDSGIEEVWRKAEENYLGIDDANRGAFQLNRWTKPTTMQGPVETNSAAARGEGEAKSTAFVRLTSRYVDAGHAKLCEILLPTNEKAFGFSATPVQDVEEGLNNDSQAVHNGIPLERNAKPGEIASATPGTAGLPGTPPAAETGVAPGVPITVSDVAKEALDKANAKAKKAEKRIYDWMVESGYRAEVRKVVFDAAKLGAGVLKGPFPRAKVYKRIEGGALKIMQKVAPAWEWKSVWNIYPDPACGENIRDGDHLFEYDSYSRKQLRALKKDPGYLKDKIDQLLEAGPKGSRIQGQKPNEIVNKHQYQVWHFYGVVPKTALIEAGAPGVSPADARKDMNAIVTMVDDVVVKAVLNPLDSGNLPYHNMAWQRRAGFWAGVGVAEQIEMPQRAINGAVRAMFNNAGKSAGGIIVLDKGAVEPADGSWTLTPDKIFHKKADSQGDDVKKAFEFYTVPNVTNQLMVIVEMCLRLAEESTNIPLVTQGQSGTTSPETYGATQLQNNNANQLLRSIGYTFDDQITEPVVLDTYEYLLLDPEVPEDEKGDWTVDAHGSAALVERAIQDQTVRQMGEFALQPAFGVNPRKWFAQFSRVNKLDPSEFQYSEAEQREIDKRGTPPPPAVQVAQLKVADAKENRQLQQVLAKLASDTTRAITEAENRSRETIAQLRAQVEEMRIQKDTDRDTAYVEAEAQRTQADGAYRMRQLEIQREIALLNYANKNDLKLMDVKKDLAKSAAELQTQKEIAGLSTAADLHKHAKDVATPGTEVPGKAPNGEAFAL